MYSTLARVYDLLVLKALRYERAADLFVERLPFDPTKPITVLDAGCGTGLYTLAVLKRFPNAQITAIDESAAMLRRLEAKIERFGVRDDSVRIEIADVTKPLTHANSGYDLIICSGMLEHVALDATVLHLSRYLRPGGCFLDAAVRDNWAGQVAGAFWRFEPHSHAAIVGAFTEAGLTMSQKSLLPARYGPMRWAKKAYYFTKVSVR